MAVLFNNWAGVLSFFLFMLLAIPTDALPQKTKATTGKAATGATTKATKGTKGAAAGGATGATAATKITTATDGSMILDKTVQIK